MNIWMLFCCIFLICLPVYSAEKNTMVFPGEVWQITTPESQGIDTVKLHEAMDYLHANTSGVGTNETVIVRNGYLIWEGPDANNVHEIYSCTKTFTSTVLGLLATDGILSVDAEANKHFHKLDDQYPEYAKIRLDHLATMTSGYNSIMGDGWKFYKQDIH